MKGIKSFTAIFACCLTTSVLAVSIPTGWYVEGNIGKSQANNESWGTGVSETASGMAWNIDGGFKFMPYFAAEIGYTQYSKQKLMVGGVTAATATFKSYDIAAKAILPVYDSGFDVFGKLGGARLNASVPTPFGTGTAHATGLYLALGGDYYFAPNVGANIQWARAKGNSTTGNQDLYSIGLDYIFG